MAILDYRLGSRSQTSTRIKILSKPTKRQHVDSFNINNNDQFGGATDYNILGIDDDILSGVFIENRTANSLSGATGTANQSQGLNDLATSRDSVAGVSFSVKVAFEQTRVVLNQVYQLCSVSKNQDASLLLLNYIEGKISAKEYEYCEDIMIYFDLSKVKSSVRRIVLVATRYAKPLRQQRHIFYKKAYQLLVREKGEAEAVASLKPLA